MLKDLHNTPEGTADQDRKRELLIKLLEKRLPQQEHKDIAIIGLKGRYPMATTLADFWENLQKGRNCITEVPAERWDWRIYFDPEQNKMGKSYSKWGGFLDDVDKFDSLFFNISPQEAETLDPQERLFLETVWETFEDAGYTRKDFEKYRSRVGVFVGVMNCTYESISGEAWGMGVMTTANSSFWSIANRISYFFDFMGPSLAVDTACSSSLTAIHLACESLKSGESYLALAGGVNLILHPKRYVTLSLMNMLSSDEKCRCFGQGADGFVDSEGVGAVLLKPLQRARDDNDHIYAVIKGTAINAGGKTSGYTVPNPNAQADLILETLQKAEINPRSISYVEAHGTGTSLGDPIEILGLTKAFRKFGQDKQFCAIGSVKSNMGHAESAAGIAGLTKIILQMEHETLAPSLHADSLNNSIDFSSTPFFVQRQLGEWKRPVITLNGKTREFPRRACLSSFGAGGANAHLIVEEHHASPESWSPDEPGPQLVVLSAKDEERLKEYADRLCRYLEKIGSEDSQNRKARELLEDKLRICLREFTAEVIGTGKENLEDHLDLKEYGFNITRFTELLNRISDKFALQLPPLVFSEFPNIASLTDYLINQYPDVFSRELTGEGSDHLPIQGPRLEDIVYTLQLGRNHLQERLAFTAATVEEVRERLSAFNEGRKDLDDFFTGNIKKSGTAVPGMSEVLPDKEILAGYVKNRDLVRLAESWVAGADIDWGRLYGDHKRRRIPLPTYPFKREHYWISYNHNEPPELFFSHEAVESGREDERDGEVEFEDLSRKEVPGVTTGPDAEARRNKQVKQKFEQDVVRTIGGFLKLRSSDIKLDENIGSYGGDSIALVNISKKINKRYGLDITPASLFEYISIRDLVEDLFRKHEEVLCRYYGADLSATTESKAKPAAAPRSPGRVFPAAARRSTASTGRQTGREPIAIIGMNGAMPQSENLEVFWRHLEEKTDMVTEIPDDRWDWRQHFGDPFNDKHKTRIKWGGFMKEVDKFDPSFFNLSAAEAEFMDPQQRLFLETVWKTIEDAGYKPSDLAGSRTALLVGATIPEYIEIIRRSVDETSALALTGTSNVVLANRISFILDLHGPSRAIDTACSSSLIAIRQGVEALRRGECDLAIAGGVNVLIDYMAFVLLDKAGMMSPGGRIRTFDEKADGYIRGEGVGAVMLKPLAKAEADGDHIYAIIKGIEENHGGYASSLTAPNPKSQAALLIDTYERANVDPATISYIEAHGSGTSLGDPIEINGIKKAFAELFKKWGKPLPTEPYCGLGTVKTNIGHLETAAGMAGVFKILLALKNKKIPGILHLEKVNPQLQLENTPFYIVKDTIDWKPMMDRNNKALPRRAGISSFGYGGVNAHVILEEHIPDPSVDEMPAYEYYIVVLAAKKREQLHRYVKDLLDFINKVSDPSLILQIAYTLQVGREEYDERLAAVVPGLDVLKERLQKYYDGQTDIEDFYTGNVKENRSVSDMFSQMEESTEFVEKVIRNRKYHELARLWLMGVKVNWRLLYEGFQPGRISLPTYPFARERYWIPVTRQAAPEAVEIESPAETTAKPAQESPGVALSLEDDLRQELRRMIVELLNLKAEVLDDEENLRVYGFNSLVGIRLLNRLKDIYDATVTNKVLDEHNTISSLVQYLSREESVKKRFEEGKRIEEVTEEAETIPDQPYSYPLSSGQKGLWVIHQMAPESYAYNVPTAFRLKQDIPAEILKKATGQVVLRHPALRTRIQVENSEPVQVVLPEAEFFFEEFDISSVPVADEVDFLKERVRRPFDLEKGPLMRVHLFHRSPTEHILLLVLHHIIQDGFSTFILLKDIFTILEAEAAGQAAKLPRVRATYKDFVDWQAGMMAGSEGKAHREFWLEKLSGEIPVLVLPADRPRPKFQSYHGESHVLKVPKETVVRLKDVAEKVRVGIAALMLGAYKVLLNRYTQIEDILVGTPFMGRSRTEFEEILGYMMNMIVVRTEVTGDLPLPELFDRVSTSLMDAITHGDYPFAEVVRQMGESRDRSRSSLFQVAYVFQNWLVGLEDSDTVDFVDSIYQEGEFDFTIEILEIKNEFTLSFKYNKDLFNVETIDRMARHYTSILQSIVDNPEQLVGDVALLSTGEVEKLVKEFNDTGAEFPATLTIHDLFQMEVEKQPNHLALVFENTGKDINEQPEQTQLSYRKLNERANQLARVLRREGLLPDRIAGIMVDKSIEMVVGILAILKAGGAYLPIDTDYPAERIAFMLQDSKTNLLLTQRHLAKETKKLQFEGQVLKLDDKSLYSGKGYNLEQCNKPTHLAYLIYTSGTTGKPKGVMLRHIGIANLKLFFMREFGLNPDDRVIQFSNLSFDASVWEMSMTLLNGAELHIANKHLIEDIARFSQYMSLNLITVATLPPTYAVNLDPGSIRSLRLLITAGSEANFDLVKRWKDQLEYINAYGPTETTICATIWRVPETIPDYRTVPIGKPIQNSSVFIVDENNQLTPIGVTGELCIGGIGLAKGYLYRPDLTRQKFVDNPFVAGEKMYRTGDLARWLPDGNIEFLGRIDHQIKLRGFRIELEEIESQLQGCEGVKESIVVSRTGRNNETYLCAYFVSDMEIDTADLKRSLSKKLPDYMIPGYFVRLDRIPLTPNDKVDRKALPDPQEITATGPYVPPRNDFETGLAEIWKNILGVEKVGIMDDFFEIGGHSILAAQMLLKIKNQLNRTISLAEVLEYPTIAGIAGKMEGSQQSEGEAPREQEGVDFSREIMLAPEIKPAGTIDSAPVLNIENVFLTGVTGFVGAFLLHEILCRTETNIYCLVRAKTDDEAGQRIRSAMEMYSLWESRFDNRIRPVTGDLSQPSLGLSEEQFRHLAETVDLIYHNGALVNFIYPYPALKAANVSGTVEVLRMAANGKPKSVHYISTGAVFDPSNTIALEDDPLDLHEGLIGGYAQSKWVAEKLVMAARERGIPSITYRPGRITGDVETGKMPTHDFFPRMLKGYIQMKKAPDLEMMIDMIPVDYVAREIVHLSLQADAYGKSFHLVNPNRASIFEIIGWINEFGFPVEVVPIPDWLTLFSAELEKNPDNALAPFATMFEAMQHNTEGTRGMLGMEFSHRNTETLLAGTDLFRFPDSKRLLDQYFSYFVRSGFLPSPRKRGSKAKKGGVRPDVFPP